MNIKLSRNSFFLKKIKTPIVCLTAYTAPIAKMVDKFADVILVGDSLGPVLYDFKSTRKVTLEMIIRHAQSVVKSAKRCKVVVDMPYGTYKNPREAYNNAQKILRLTGAFAVKLEGGESIIESIRYLTKKKINVMGHIGMLPQKMNGKYKVYGKTKLEQKQIFRDLEMLIDANVFSIVIECTVESIVKDLVKKSTIPLIGIGASPSCDGQILVTEDLLGISGFDSKFLKKYAEISVIIEKSLERFSNDVRKKKFPKKINCYK